jgi:hypothetical protein
MKKTKGRKSRETIPLMRHITVLPDLTVGTVLPFKNVHVLLRILCKPGWMTVLYFLKYPSCKVYCVTCLYVTCCVDPGLDADPLKKGNHGDGGDHGADAAHQGEPPQQAADQSTTSQARYPTYVISENGTLAKDAQLTLAGIKTKYPENTGRG